MMYTIVSQPMSRMGSYMCCKISQNLKFVYKVGKMSVLVCEEKNLHGKIRR